jgi:16S rRNA (guanine1516-N2)-methyltransferase
VTTLGAATPGLAGATGLPHNPLADIVLEHLAGRLQLRDTRAGAPGPLWMDFASRDADKRRAAGRGLLLARACGVRKGKPPPRVIDATAGLGRDAHTLAALGCPVSAIERNPAAIALLRDALDRAAADPAAAKITLVAGDAATLLARLPRADVVCVDPMFPDTGRTALSRKEMQYFQAIIEPGDDAGLFQAALASGAHRVVVKRPKVAPPLAPARKVDVVFKGGSVRFDVYLQ